ncbi:MAG: DNA-processing protein DprA [Anaerolineae bacterium]|nr:DNA-processing protein DprA [Anaerolineae bacterium]
MQQVGLDRRALGSLVKMRKALDLDRVMEAVQRAGVDVLTWADDAYPASLRNIHDPPPVLYVKGALTETDAWAVAVVGTRKATAYGRQITEQLVDALARSGVTIVSGLAKGIDAVAHRAALNAGGRTVAVLGSGVDVIYPSEHRDLAQAIAGAGALVSDYPLGAQPEAANFPPRNRIISGLALGVLITEAGDRSGALITADYANNQGRDVFAVPGNVISPGSRGTNRLIQDGAKLVMGVEDILTELNLGMVEQQAEVREAIPTTEIEAQLMTLLADAPMHIDDLCRLSEMSIAEVSSSLTLMELKGLVRQVGAMQYAVAHDARARYVVD